MSFHHVWLEATDSRHFQALKELLVRDFKDAVTFKDKAMHKATTTDFEFFVDVQRAPTNTTPVNPNKNTIFSRKEKRALRNLGYNIYERTMHGNSSWPSSKNLFQRVLRL